MPHRRLRAFGGAIFLCQNRPGGFTASCTAPPDFFQWLPQRRGIA